MSWTLGQRAKFAHVQIESGRTVNREADHYNLDVIIPVGYRVKSTQGTQFRQWATATPRENLLGKMKQDTRLGSRLAEVHTGSSLFTGDASQGESNIRRWIIERDWLETIVALPLNMFYNTGIATYIWVLTNRQPAHRKGKVQLIDATGWYKPRRKNLGEKNCELSDEDIARICDAFLKFEETEHSKIFPNAAFGYWKATVERPLRLKGIDPERVYTPKEIREIKETAERADDAPPVIRKIHKRARPRSRCAGCSRQPSAASRRWSSTSPIPTCGIPSSCR